MKYFRMNAYNCTFHPHKHTECSVQCVATEWIFGIDGETDLV